MRQRGVGSGNRRRWRRCRVACYAASVARPGPRAGQTARPGKWSWAGSSRGAGPPRTAAPAPSWRSWPGNWGRAYAGRRRRPGRRGTPAGAWLTASAGTSAPSRRRVCQSCPHLVLIAARSEAYTRALLGTNPGRLCAKSREMCHDRSREWPPVVRDVRDPDADRRHSATSCTQVRLGRRHLRRPCSGARLPKVGMSRGQPGGPRRRPPGRRGARAQ